MELLLAGYASTCRELKHLSSIQRDGEYKLLIHGKHIPVSL